MVRLSILEEALQKLEGLFREESLDTRDPDLKRIIEKLSAEARAMRRSLNGNSFFITHMVRNPRPMATTKEPTILERRLNELAAQFAQTHDEKIKTEILELAKKLPTKSN